MIGVLLVDDQQLFREGLRVILDLEEDIDVVGEAADGVEALELNRRLHPDVVLLDVEMPRLDGLSVAERLLGSTGAPRLIMLTGFDRDGYLYRALRAGVSGFLLKDAPRARLVEAVRVVAQGEELLAPAITRRLVAEFVQRRDLDDAVLARLTSREREVLRLVGEGLSNSEIADRLILGAATVKTHVGNVFAKCGLRDRAQAVVLAYETGLVSPGNHLAT